MQVNQKNAAPKRRYITGLDGIRAIAVVAVIIFHLLPYSIKGGYLGVSMFFTVSGYLITDLLMQEWEQRGRIDLGRFYYRRMRRLYPALVTMIVGTGAYITLFQRSLLTNLRATIWTNLLYVYNWWEIGHGQSYFDRFQGESPFTHLWSLSIEAQYYLVWPVILWGLLKLFKARFKIGYWLFWVAGLMAIWEAYIYHSTTNINRVYYGTDTRMFSILFGVALALVWPSNRLNKRLGWALKWLLNAIGGLSLIGIGYLLFTLAGQNPATYNWGMLAITLLTTLLVAACVHPAAGINRMLTNPVFKWIGTRSYGIYLYQFPVMIFYESRVTSIGEKPLVNAAIEIGIILLISEFSYRMIETPLRHFDFKLSLADGLELFKFKSRYGNKRLLMVPFVALTVIAGAGAVHPGATRADADQDLKQTIHQNQALTDNNNRRVRFKPTQKPKGRIHGHAKPKQAIRLSKPELAVQKDYQLTKPQVLAAKGVPLTAIGDSVMADCAADLQRVFKNAYVSAEVGRQITQAPDIISQLAAQNRLAPNVLINLGTNGPVSDDQVAQVVKQVGAKRHVYWINAHVPTRNWEGEVNTTLARAAHKYANFHVIDWNGYSADKPQLFWDDHVHPNPKGNVQYVHLIAQTIAK